MFLCFHEIFLKISRCFIPHVWKYSKVSNKTDENLVFRKVFLPMIFLFILEYFFYLIKYTYEYKNATLEKILSHCVVIGSFSVQPSDSDPFWQQRRGKIKTFM